MDRVTGGVGAPFEAPLDNGDFAISPDGDTILYSHVEKPTLTAVRVRDGVARDIELKPPIVVHSVSFADAKSIVVTGGFAASAVLARSDLAGNATVLARSEQALIGPRVARDGRKIVLVEKFADDDVWLVEPK